MNSPDPYVFRSQMCPWVTCVYDVRKRDVDYETLRKRHAQWKEVSPRFLKDFYPLTPYSTDDTTWAGWQFDDPEGGRGVVQVFRRGGSIYESASLKLRGLDADATDTLTDLDTDAGWDSRGRDLERGSSITLKRCPGSLLVTYRRK